MKKVFRPFFLVKILSKKKKVARPFSTVQSPIVFIFVRGYAFQKGAKEFTESERDGGVAAK